MSIKIDEKYGLNPTIETCILCGNKTGNLILLGKLLDEEGNSIEAPKSVITGNICDKCMKENKDNLIVLENEGGQITGRAIIIPKVDISQEYLDTLGGNNIVYMTSKEFNKIAK